MARKSAQKTVLPNTPVGRHKNLLSNPHILDWYLELCLRSRLSADTYLSLNSRPYTGQVRFDWA